MQILLVQDDADIREKLAFSIESTFPGAAVVALTNLAEATKRVASDVKCELAIIDLPTAPKAEIEGFLNQFKNFGTLLFDVPPGQAKREVTAGVNLFGVLDRQDVILNTTTQIRKLMELNKISAPAPSNGLYTRIRTHILLSVAPLKGDVFLKLGDSHYVKLFRNGDSFEQTDLEKYTEKKKIEYLYLRTDQTQEFVRKYQTELLALLQSSMSIDETARAAESIYDTIQSLGQSLGFNKDVQTMARTSMKMTVTSMGKSPQLSQILDRLDAFGGQYISAHSTLTGFLGCAIASHLEWGSEATFHKLTLAAMLHDITLENHELAAVNALEDLEKGEFTPKEKKEYRSHMVTAAEVARKFTEVPADVDAIIAQHHERPDGKGFPRGLTHTYISPLGAVFIVAHDMAQQAWLERDKGFESGKFVAAARKKYSSNQFRKILTAIEKLYPGV